MYFATIAVLSTALASSTLAAPGAPEHPIWKKPGGDSWFRRKQVSPPSYEPPTPDSGTECPTPTNSTCLTDEQAAAGAEIFRRLIQDYSDELALDALTEDFVDYSSAVNIIRNRGNEGPFVVNEISFNGRAAFMAAQGSQPEIPFDTLNTFHGCNHVATRWQTLRSANGQATESNDIVSSSFFLLLVVEERNKKKKSQPHQSPYPKTNIPSSPIQPVVGNGILVTVPDSNNTYGFRVKELYSEFNAAAWLVNNGVFTPSAVTTSNFPEATAPPQKRTHESLLMMKKEDLMDAAGRMI